ncbi:hypothetical protein [Sphingomonas sp. LHG3406-1]|uniref:hypothetical protein n=1 Tax=Sphingomonas sp. LHG3406-1 TaxID=2804617 RepID=UPI00262EFAE8|nr:hypothetical protein [Sphingomonas sp. LHG3406-1]
MQRDSLVPLATRGEIHDFVLSLWSDGPVRRSHEGGGLVARIVERFARLPRFFYRASEQRIEWTHFSPWWGGVMLVDYDNPAIRDLRYLHEIYHSATMPYLADCNLATLEAITFRNEREASTFTEMAIYCELPELRELVFDHPIFADRFLFPEGRDRLSDEWRRRWRDDRWRAFQQLLTERTRVVLASLDEIDPTDPQIVWLRRYGEQGAHWLRIWGERHGIVQRLMLDLERAGDRREALNRHLDALLAPAVTEGGDIPFRTEAQAFRDCFDGLIATYDAAMNERSQVAVRGRGEI